MQQRLNILWVILLLMVGIFSILYIWYTLYPGKIDPEVLRYFSRVQVLRGREYNRLPQLMYIAAYLLQVLVLSGILFSQKGQFILQGLLRLCGGRYWAAVVVFSIFLWALLQLLSLPFSFASGFHWQHRWGFSTQSLASWWIDYVKSAGIELPLYLAGILLYFWAQNTWPKTWWILSAVFLSLWLVVQMIIWPVWISPLFNRFEPAQDARLVQMVDDLGRKAGIPVQEVLIMDASRRTTKANAYFTGVGHTKRIVLYDTLVSRYSMAEVKSVVAHEMAHWKENHIIKGLLWGILANFALWGILFLILGGAGRAGTKAPLQSLTVLFLFFQLALFCGNPLQSYISRSMETQADQTSVLLTGDKATAVSLEVNLSTRNLSDVSPAPFLEWFSYSHPQALKRIRSIEAVRLQ